MMPAAEAEALKQSLTNLHGVLEVAVLPQELTVILKIDKSKNVNEAEIETLVHQLLKG